MINTVKSPIISYQFNCVRNNQKKIIDILINYTDYDIHKLSDYMEMTVSALLDVKQGDAYLENSKNRLLGYLFLISFG